MAVAPAAMVDPDYALLPNCCSRQGKWRRLVVTPGVAGMD